MSEPAVEGQGATGMVTTTATAATATATARPTATASDTDPTDTPDTSEAEGSEVDESAPTATVASGGDAGSERRRVSPLLLVGAGLVAAGVAVLVVWRRLG